MDKVLEFLSKVSRGEDQALIGLTRFSHNVDAALKILQASREADLGPETNAVVEKLIEIGKKLQVIVGSPR